jgi:tetratricopeptide (TPR) repeat protein
LRAAVNRANNAVSKQMAGDLQIQYDDAVLAYTMGDYVVAIAGFEAVLAAEPGHFEAQLSLGMAFYRQENYERAIAEGHKAEAINSAEQRVHTNLSLAYMKNGEKEKAEHHGLQAKIAGWKDNMDVPDAGDGAAAVTDLKMAEEKSEAIKMPTKFPDQPWKKKKD